MISFGFQVLHKNLELHSDESLLKSFIDLSEHCPKFLRNQLDTIVDLMLNVRVCGGCMCVYVCAHIDVSRLYFTFR